MLSAISFPLSAKLLIFLDKFKIFIKIYFSYLLYTP